MPDNAISEIDYNDPMAFFDIEKSKGKVIYKELKSNLKNKKCMSLNYHLVILVLAYVSINI